MKLAYFSPLPPQKSGISDYSEALLPYLSKYYEVDLWVSGPKPAGTLAHNYRIINYPNPGTQLSKLKKYDVILYNLGNNPGYHAEIYEVFLKYPGYVILHDYVLFFLVTGYFLDRQKDREGYIREFYFNYGKAGINNVKTVLRGPYPPLQFQNPEWYPLIKRLILTAPGIIVHSEYSKKKIILDGYPESNIVKINSLHYDSANLPLCDAKNHELRERFGIQKNDFVIASFGYVAPTKRNREIIEVITQIISSTNESIKYVMVGEGNYVDGLLNDNIIKTGYVSNDDLETFIDCTDIVVNLRFPSMGETSATLIRALSKGKTCIVSDIAWFSEIPDDVVIKITIDSVNEKHELMNALLLILNDQPKMIEYGRRARSFILKFHDPDSIAKSMVDFFANCLGVNDNFSKYYMHRNNNRMNELGLKENTNTFIQEYGKKQCEMIQDLGMNYCVDKPKKFQLKRLINKFLFRQE
jgi:glycosyltransferase involved in cell wall biosynthesis